MVPAIVLEIPEGQPVWFQICIEDDGQVIGLTCISNEAVA